MDLNLQQNQLQKLTLKAENLFKEGKLIQSQQLFQQILSSNHLNLFLNLYYQCLLNLSTIHLQQNQFQQATKLLTTAIKLNQSRYEAFYNLALANFYSLKNTTQTISCLEYCLSLLYSQLGTLTLSLKLLNKSISLNPTNLKTYLKRAFIYQKNNKEKLAQNQYEKLTFQNDLHQFNPSVMVEIYLQKALFYRRINKIQKMQESLILFNRLKKQAQNQNKKQTNPKIKHILQLQDDGPQDQSQSKQTIRDMLRQVQSLINQISDETVKKYHNKKDQNNIKTINQLQQKNQHIKQNIQQSKFKKGSEINQEVKLLQPDLLDQQNSKQKSLLEQSYRKQEYPSISVNEDEDSAILNHKIEELQRQIKESGGNVPQIKDISRNSEEENFLEFEIQKTIEEINQKKLQQQQKNLKSSTQRSSLGEDVKSLMSNSESERRKSSFYDDAMTLRSKISESYEINMEEMRTYDSFQLEIRSVSIFDQHCSKKQAFIKIKYLSKELLTEKCKNQKLTWNHNFEEETIVHPSEQQEDESVYQLTVQLHAQQGGWLSWNRDILLGTGTIKLTQKGATKCTLQLTEQKVGMLYYKIKLKKNQTE